MGRAKGIFKLIVATIIMGFTFNLTLPVFAVAPKAYESNSYEVEQMLKGIISEYGNENIVFEDGIYAYVNEETSANLNEAEGEITWISKDESILKVENGNKLLGVKEGTTFIVGEKDGKHHIREVYVSDKNMVQAYYNMADTRGSQQYVVYLDPGHGGVDPGASGNGIIEKDIVLDFAKRVKAKLEAKGIRVIMSRESDVFVSLADRSKGANYINPDVFVSIHINSFGNSDVKGIETYYNKEMDKKVASVIQDKLISYTGAVNRGAKWQDFHVVRETKMPASLVECGFLSNPTEASNMKNPNYQEKLINAITDGISEYLGGNSQIGSSTPIVANRIFGLSRYETSYEIFQRGWVTSDNVVLASGEDYPDALCAAPLAAKYDAPILLSQNRALQYQPELLDLIKSKGVKNVFIVGGTGVIPQVIEKELASMGISSKRLGGLDRFETSLQIAKEVGNGSGEVSLVSGYQFADGLSMSPIAAKKKSPILLTETTYLPKGVKEFINSNGFNKVYIVGGSGVVSDSVKQNFKNTERLGGLDRYETNLMVFNKFKNELDLSRVFIASALTFPDALSVSALAGKNNNFVVLSNTEWAEKSTKSLIESIRPQLRTATVLGSNALIPDSVLYSLGINQIK